MTRANWLRFGIASVVLLISAHLVDRWVYWHVVDTDIYEQDIGRLLRIMGFLPTWLLAGTALVLHDWPARLAGDARSAWHRGILLVGSAVTGGLFAEILKLILRRDRPRAHDGEYVFRAFSDRPFHSGGLAFPSSHVLVAFSAAAMLARLFPRTAPVWFFLATGCAYTRVATRAHFVSDVILAALVGFLVPVFLLRLRWLRARQGTTPPQTPQPTARPA
jgi:membrane-associated phospholipid phosphatase